MKINMGNGHVVDADLAADLTAEELRRYFGDEIPEAIAEEAHAANEVKRGRGRPSLGDSGVSPQVAVRLAPDLRARLSERAAELETTEAEVLRRALSAFLESA